MNSQYIGQHLLDIYCLFHERYRIILNQNHLDFVLVGLKVFLQYSSITLNLVLTHFDQVETALVIEVLPLE